MGKETYFVCLEGKSYSHYSRPSVDVCGCMSMGCMSMSNCLWLYGESMCGLSTSKCGVSALRVYGVNTV